VGLKGTCVCGAVHFEISGAFKGAGHCHCSTCRKAHGAAFATWAHIEPSQFGWRSGETLVGRYRSSPNRQRLYCKQCGSQLASTYRGEITEIVLGTIDGDPGVRPSEHIFVGSKAPWYEITDALPQYKEWPPGFGP
jgi:hypothetical protein